MKVKIDVIDFLQYFGKYPIGHTDKNGKDICYGHTVLYGTEKHLIGYRYGNPVLKQPFTIFNLQIKDWSQVEVLNEVTSANEYLIIGWQDETFIKQLIDAEVVIL